MSALDRLNGLMTNLKEIEHERWDTAAHAVLELAHKIGLGGAAPIAAPDINTLADQVTRGLAEKLDAHLQTKLAELSAGIDQRIEAKFNELLAKAEVADAAAATAAPLMPEPAAQPAVEQPVA
jgi:hypothetical protein